jgi:hypothetical protein
MGRHRGDRAFAFRADLPALDRGYADLKGALSPDQLGAARNIV